MKSLIKFIMCNIFDDHKWTSASMQGVPPTDKQVDAGVAGFKEYATMYCDRCGKESKLSINWKASIFK